MCVCVWWSELAQEMLDLIETGIETAQVRWDGWSGTEYGTAKKGTEGQRVTVCLLLQEWWWCVCVIAQ